MPVSIIWYSSTARSGAGRSQTRHAGLVGPDRDVAGACSVDQAPGPVGFAAGVLAALAVQHDQQRPVPLPGVVRVQGGGEPARPQPDHEIGLARPGRADDHHVPRARGGREGEDRLPAGSRPRGWSRRPGWSPSGSAGEPSRGRRCGLGRADLPFPLAGVEGDRGGGHPAADPGADRVVPPGPQARRPGPARPGPRPGTPARTSAPRPARRGCQPPAQSRTGASAAARPPCSRSTSARPRRGRSGPAVAAAARRSRAGGQPRRDAAT